MIDTNCSDKYKALRKNLLDAILITREEWDEYQNLKEENDKLMEINKQHCELNGQLRAKINHSKGKQGRRVYISNLEYTKTHDGVGGVSGQFVFKDPIPYEEYEKMVSETYFWLSDGIYKDKEYVTTDEMTYESLATRIDELQDAIDKVGEIIQDFYDYDYEDENWARLDTICKINRVVKDLMSNNE